MFSGRGPGPRHRLPRQGQLQRRRRGREGRAAVPDRRPALQGRIRAGPGDPGAGKGPADPPDSRPPPGREPDGQERDRQGGIRPDQRRLQRGQGRDRGLHRGAGAGQAGPGFHQGHCAAERPPQPEDGRPGEPRQGRRDGPHVDRLPRPHVRLLRHRRADDPQAPPPDRRGPDQVPPGGRGARHGRPLRREGRRSLPAPGQDQLQRQQGRLRDGHPPAPGCGRQSQASPALTRALREDQATGWPAPEADPDQGAGDRLGAEQQVRLRDPQAMVPKETKTGKDDRRPASRRRSSETWPSRSRSRWAR